MPSSLNGKELMPRIEAVPAVPINSEESSVEADLRAQEAEPPEENFLEEEQGTEQLQPAQEKSPVPTRSSAVSQATVQTKDEVTLEVEKVLEEGLGDFYASLPPNGKVIFRKKGEEASSEIAKMVNNLQLNFKRALQLIRDWLLTVPKVNKFFLEQEAKIKVDKINLLIEARKEDLLHKP